jgi:hypothetical protein
VSIPYRLASQHARLYRDLAERLAAQPGVTDATAVTGAPLTGVEHLYPVEAGVTPVVFRFFVPGYIQTMEMRPIEGATMAPAESIAEPNPVLVSESLARRLYPSQSAVGRPVRRLQEDGSIVTLGRTEVPPFTIAGVVADVRETSLRGDPAETVYIPMIEPSVERSLVPTNVTFVLRTDGPAGSLAAVVRRTIGEMLPDVGVGQIRTMDAIVSSAQGREAFVGALLVVAAAIALFLGAAGIYGSVAEVVRRRTREIGIRLALGADIRGVLRLVSGTSLRSALVGTALGLAGAILAARALGSLLFGVTPGDPVVLLLVVTCLLLVTASAGLLAAWRATRIEPLLALRGD